MPPPRMTTRFAERPVRVKSERLGARNGGAAAAAVGARPNAPMVANSAPAPPVTPTERRNSRLLTGRGGDTIGPPRGSGFDVDRSSRPSITVDGRGHYRAVKGPAALVLDARLVESPS